FLCIVANAVPTNVPIPHLSGWLAHPKVTHRVLATINDTMPPGGVLRQTIQKSAYQARDNAKHPLLLLIYCLTPNLRQRQSYPEVLPGDPSVSAFCRHLHKLPATQTYR